MIKVYFDRSKWGAGLANRTDETYCPIGKVAAKLNKKSISYYYDFDHKKAAYNTMRNRLKLDPRKIYSINDFVRNSSTKEEKIKKVFASAGIDLIYTGEYKK